MTTESNRYRVWIEDASGSLQEIDMDTGSVELLSLTVGYEGARVLEFIVHEWAHSVPFGYRPFIVVADTNYETGTDWTPIFEGYAINPTPGGDSREVKYTAFDASHFAGEVPVMSGLSTGCTASQEVPKKVFNVTTETDEDFPYQRLYDAEIGEMVDALLSDAYTDLWPIHAAPDPSQFPGKPAYDVTELAKLDLKPQEKVVMDGIKLRDALTMLLGYYPQYKPLFIPGPQDRQWRLIDCANAPQLTLEVDAPDITDAIEFPVIELDLQRSIDQRATAIKIYGPRASVYHEVSVSAGTLTPLWGPGEQAIALSVGPTMAAAGYPQVGRVWQIADETKRRMACRLPSETLVPATEELGGNQAFIRTQSPSLLATFDNSKTWYNVKNWRPDRFNGIVTAPAQLFNRNAGIWELPTDVMLKYAYLDEPLYVRVPETGYTGTAYTVAGIEYEHRMNAEDLAVGWEYYQPVTTAERRAQFQKYGEQLLLTTKDILYTGGLTIDGLDWRFLNLNLRLNFEMTVDGQPYTTGWEDINAIVTEVAYDLKEGLTVVTLSNDWAQFVQQDPTMLREMLRIRAMQTTFVRNVALTATGQSLTLTTTERFVHSEVSATEPLTDTTMELSP